MSIATYICRIERHTRARPASMARQSLPVAITTASTPFMMPLLCVAARYGSATANAHASMIPSRTFSPEKSPKASSSTGIVQRERGQAVIGKVGEYPQMDPAARDRFDSWAPAARRPC